MFSVRQVVFRDPVKLYSIAAPSSLMGRVCVFLEVYLESQAECIVILI